MYNVDLRWIEAELKKFCKKHHQLKQALEDELKELEKNPTRGELMKYLPLELQGCVRKLYIMGRNGFRLVYYWKTGELSIKALTIFQRKEEYNLNWNDILRKIES